ncbi:MAG: ABC transporter ATP-binding protein [Pseudomonadota bacterium]
MLIFDKVSHSYGKQRALDDLSFECASGQITCLIGPSGCGKTTALRLAAGLLPLQSGTITLDGDVLAGPEGERPPERRPVGMVFQEGALFPHLTVAGNVAYGLPREGRAERIVTLLERVGLADFADRYPDSLSGGQRQRVALARALGPQPRALLFDEPYANLDIQLRRRLRDDARRMIADSGKVGVFVTHDPEEVAAIADHVVVLDHGRIVQQGAPQSLYDAPESLHVAQLFGDSQTVAGVLEGPTLTTPFGAWSRDCLIDPSIADGEVTTVLRPHQLTLEVVEQGARVEEVQAAGRCERVWVLAQGAESRILVELQPGASPPAGACVRLEPAPGTVFATGSQDSAE